jgi:hypothetical protein
LPFYEDKPARMREGFEREDIVEEKGMVKA